MAEMSHDPALTTIFFWADAFVTEALTTQPIVTQIVELADMAPITSARGPPILPEGLHFLPRTGRGTAAGAQVRAQPTGAMVASSQVLCRWRATACTLAPLDAATMVRRMPVDGRDDRLVPTTPLSHNLAPAQTHLLESSL